MRERRFRMYSKLSKKMSYDVEFVKKEDGFWFVSELGIIQHHRDSEGSTRIFVMDYANVVDKTGDMIFEGDVLHEDNGNNWVVEWYKTGLQMRSIETGDLFFTLYKSCELKILQIIGNIYENPELLESK
ncbi:MAG: YopX family protein [Candidatus Humimicrobiaceae bacterium]